MRSTAAIDSLILWHVAGILSLAWLIAAVISLDGLRAQASYAPAKSIGCNVEYDCDLSPRSMWQLHRRQNG
jgi:hypothetical protein